MSVRRWHDLIGDRDVDWDEAAITRPWHRVDDPPDAETGWVGTSIGEGIPYEDMVGEAATRMREGSDPSYVRALESAVYINVGHSHGSGNLIRATEVEGNGERSALLLITAKHVLPTKRVASRATCYRHYMKDSKRLYPFKLDPDSLFVRAAVSADVVVCAVIEGSPGLAAGDLAKVGIRETASTHVGQVLHVLSHPNAAPLSLSHGHTINDNARTGMMMHDADTLPGSSGAGIFDDAWSLIGIHTSASTMWLDGKRRPINHGVGLDPILTRLLDVGWEVRFRSTEPGVVEGTRHDLLIARTRGPPARIRTTSHVAASTARRRTRSR